MVEEEFHDAATVHTGENITLTGDEWKELHILIEITYNNKTEARTSSQKHLLVLQAMGNAFDPTELKIFDQKNRELPLQQCREMKDQANYEHRFTIHQGNGRHYVIFRVSTTVGFQGLKRESAVMATLKKTGCYLKKHLWGQDKWDIVTLGFMVELDPGRHMPDEVRQQVLDLAKAKECVTVPSARFKLVAQRFKLRHNGSVCNADAYGVQCMRIDAQEVDRMMKKTYRVTKTYVKNRLRKESPQAYINALRMQNKYITNVKTVIIVGITRGMMAEIRPLLLAETNIDHVAETRKSNSIGRWDILTNETNRKQVIGTITEKLPTWIASCATDHEKPEDFPDPGITTKAETKEDSSQGDVSYLSSSAGSYDSIMENESGNDYDESPTQRSRNPSSVSGYKWAQVTTQSRNAQPASSYGARSARSNVLEITTPTAVAAPPTEEIKELRATVASLTLKVDSLLEILLQQTKATQAREDTQGFNGQQPNAPYGGQSYYQPGFNQWSGQGHQGMHPPQQQTPTRNNSKNNGNAEPPSEFLNMMSAENQVAKRIQNSATQPEAKRKDDKETPIKDKRTDAAATQHQAQQGHQHQQQNQLQQYDPRMVNPYNQQRQLQFRH